MRVHLETDRLILREFTADDGDLLVDLDSDPEVMFRITGGRATSREEIEGEVLPAFLNYYARGNEFGFWAAFDNDQGNSSAGSTCGPVRGTPPRSLNWDTACYSPSGARDTQPKDRPP
jgi:RimJ/RimL family protein N-acetyltransferase